MTVKFLDLQRQYQAIKSEIDAAVLGVLSTSQYILGPEVTAFEQGFADAHGVKHGIAVNTGTSALHVGLLAAGVGPGNEVITIPMTFTATVAAISYTGATPVFVDVTPDTMTMDPAQVEAKITPNTKAIMPVHLYGQAADMAPIMKIAKRHSLAVIEDACQAHLAEYKGRKVGGFGQVSAFSFYPGKNLGAYGEGGIALTDDDGLAQKMRILRDWGQSQKYHHDMLAYNYRMDGVQGAILRVKLKHLALWTDKRRELAKMYNELLQGSGVETSPVLQSRKHVYHIYSVFHAERDKLQAYLTEEGIQTGIHYPIPVHLQNAYNFLGHAMGDFPVTEKIASTQLSLPMFPEMQQEEVERVVKTVRAFAG